MTETIKLNLFQVYKYYEDIIYKCKLTIKSLDGTSEVQYRYIKLTPDLGVAGHKQFITGILSNPASALTGMQKLDDYQLPEEYRSDSLLYATWSTGDVIYSELFESPNWLIEALEGDRFTRWTNNIKRGMGFQI